MLSVVLVDGKTVVSNAYLSFVAAAGLGRVAASCESHTFTVSSPLPLTRRWPSGLNDTLVTAPTCPLNVRTD